MMRNELDTLVGDNNLNYLYGNSKNMRFIICFFIVFGITSLTEAQNPKQQKLV
jgi:hypothetical protein